MAQPSEAQLLNRRPSIDVSKRTPAVPPRFDTCKVQTSALVAPNEYELVPIGSRQDPRKQYDEQISQHKTLDRNSSLTLTSQCANVGVEDELLPQARLRPKTAPRPPPRTQNDANIGGLAPPLFTSEPVAAEREDSVPFHHLLDMFEHSSVAEKSGPLHLESPHHINRNSAIKSESDTRRTQVANHHGENGSYDNVSLAGLQLPGNVSRADNGLAANSSPTMKKVFCKGSNAAAPTEANVYVNMECEACAGASKSKCTSPEHTHDSSSSTANHSRGQGDSDAWKAQADTNAAGKLGPADGHTSVWKDGMSVSVDAAINRKPDEDGASHTSSSSQQSVFSEPSRGPLVPSVSGKAMIRRKGLPWRLKDSFFCVPLLRALERTLAGVRFQQTGSIYFHFVGHTLARQVKILQDGTGHASVTGLKSFVPNAGPQSPFNRFRKQQISETKFEAVWAAYKHTVERLPQDYDLQDPCDLVAAGSRNMKGQHGHFFSSGKAHRKSSKSEKRERGAKPQEKIIRQSQSDTMAALHIQPVGA